MKNKIFSVVAVTFLLATLAACSGGDANSSDVTTETVTEAASEGQSETEEVTTIPNQDIDENQGDWM
jgi:ABC-type glycerol-3-phosphate transport system substrate-binding protein